MPLEEQKKMVALGWMDEWGLGCGRGRGPL